MSSIGSYEVLNRMRLAECLAKFYTRGMAEITPETLVVFVIR